MNIIRKEEATMTSGEMLSRSSSWTLACDNALLNRLKAFSESLKENANSISKECDGLSKDISHLNSRLVNVSNEFLMLSNTQFVENRVEEFEEFTTSASISNGSSTHFKSKADTEAELMSKMKQAIQLGLAACNQARQDDSSASPFKMKRPHLIGSPKFFSSKYCGLVDESSRAMLEQIPEPDSISLNMSECSDIGRPEPEAKTAITFTMPPPSIFPIEIPDISNTNHQSDLLNGGDNQRLSYDNYGHIGTRTNVPPSPTSISDKSDMLSTTASISHETMPRSVTDELNKIYSSFAPPNISQANDDSDDDFRPTPGGGRLFDEEEEDDDLFGEHTAFPPRNNNSDFFSRSNPSNLPTSIFSAPPPISAQQHLPVPKPEETRNDIASTLVGAKPKTSGTSVQNNPIDVGSEKDASIRNDMKPIAEAEGPKRPKLPPGAVSMFGGLPPPVLNSGTLQSVQSSKSVKASSTPVSNPDTQISRLSASCTVEDSSGKDTGLHGPQPGNVHSTHPSTTANQSSLAKHASGSHAPLSGAGDVNRSAKVPVTSLFNDDSSDEDIFSSRKPRTTTTQSRTSAAQSSFLPTAAVRTTTTTNTSVKQSASSKRENIEQSKKFNKKSIFEDSDSDEGIFSARKVGVKDGRNSKPDSGLSNIATQSQAKKALFEDESDSDTDLFGNKKVRKVMVEKASKMEPTDNSTPIEDASSGDANVDSAEPNNNNNNNAVASKSESSSDLLQISETAPNVQEEIKGSIFESESTNATAVPAVPKPLFEDDSESDSDLFANSANKKSHSVALPKDQPPVFDNLENSVDANTKIIENSAPETEIVPNKSEPIVVKPESRPKEPVTSLFAEDIKSKIISKPQPSLGSQAKTKKLFLDDDSDSDSDLFASKSAKKTISAAPLKIDSVSDLGISDTAAAKDETVSSEVKKDEVDGELGDLKTGKTGISTVKISSQTSKKNAPIARTVKSLFDDDSDSDTDLFKNKSKSKVVSVPTAPTKSAKQGDVFINPDAVDVTKKDEVVVESDPAATTKHSDKPEITKPKVSVKALKLALNINPLAMMGGARLPKLTKTQSSTASTPEGVESSASTPKDEDTQKPIASSEKELKEDHLKSDNAIVDDNVANNDHFVSIIKARPKIHNKRRPPSRIFLKSVLLQDANSFDDTDMEQSESSEQKQSDKAEESSEQKESDQTADSSEQKESSQTVESKEEDSVEDTASEDVLI